MNALKEILENKKLKSNNVKNYQMKEGNYLVRIRIFEGSDYKPIEANGSAQTFVVADVLGVRNKTPVIKDTLSPLYDKSFNYEFTNLDKGKLEAGKIKIEVWEYNRFFPNELMGSYEIDLTTVYYQPHHQYNRTWFTLAADDRDGVIGYVLANIEVLGPGDEPHVVEKITEDSTNQTVVSSKIKKEGHLIIAEIYKAEHVVPMKVNTKNIRLVVNLNYGGVTQSTDPDPEEQLNPVFNQTIYLQAMLPNHSKNVQMELYDKRTFGSNMLIGTGLIPFNTFKYLDDLPPTWINIYGPPLSGVGERASDMARFGARRGSCYRGRVLVRMSSRDHENPMNKTLKMAFKPPEMMVPTPPSKTYTLRIDIYSGQELPGDKGMLHFVLGPYLLKTKVVEKQAGKMVWDETVELNRVILPMDATMIPDLVVYFADQDYESHRKCFFRVKAVKMLARSKKRYEKSKIRPKIVKLKEDYTLKLVEDDQFSGFVTVRPVLFAYKPPEKIVFDKAEEQGHKHKFKIRFFCYIARNLPSADDGGISNPFVMARCAGKTMITSTKRRTLNPEWYETLETTVELSDINNPNTPNPTLVIMVYHSDDGKDFKKEDLENKRRKKVLLGRYWLDLDIGTKKKFKGEKKTIDVIYKKPKWIPIIYDKDDVSEGKLMISYSLVAEKDDEVIQDMIKKKNVTSIEPEYKEIEMSLFTIGIRNIIDKVGFYQPIWCSAEIQISRDFEVVETDPTKIRQLEQEKEKQEKKDDERFVSQHRLSTNHSRSTSKSDNKHTSLSVNKLIIGKTKVVNGGITFNRTFRFKVKAPYNPEVCPVLEVFLFHYPLGQKVLLGASTFELKNVLGFFYGEEDDSDYKKSWKDFFSTANDNRMETKAKPPKFKLPKVRPENRLLFMDDLVYNLPSKFESKKKQKRKIWKERFKANAIINKLQKWENEKLSNLGGQANKYMSERIELEDLQRLNNEERERIKERCLIETEDFENEIKNSDYIRKVQQKLELERNERNPDGQGIVASFNNSRPGQSRIKSSNMLSKSRIGTDNNLSKQKGYQTNQNLMSMEGSMDAPGQNPMTSNEDLVRSVMGDQNVDEAEKEAQMMDRQIKGSEKSESVIENFALDGYDEISELQADVSEKALRYDNVFVKERVESKKNKKLQKKKRKAGLFGGGFSLKQGFSFLFGDSQNKIEYIDFDTDEEEEIDDVPEYLKGRPEFQTALEDEILNEKGIIKAFQIRRGNKRDKDSYYGKKLTHYEDVGTFKCLFLREDKKDLIPLPKVKKFLHDMLRERKYTLRVYILKGVGITPNHDSEELSSYVNLNLNGVNMDSEEDSQLSFFPEYYRMFEFKDVKLPGSAYLNIDIVENGLFDSIVGSTVVDLEERVCNIKWQKMKMKPVEKRTIENPGKGARGKLEMWIELINPRHVQPPISIFPRTQVKYELRVIVWETKDCVFKDETTACNDLYGRGGLKRHGNSFKMTDTHWRCRSKGSFNWRWKFDLMLPIDQNKNYGEDTFVIQLWDRDLISSDDLIGEAEIDLNTHKMLKKGHSRKNKVVPMRRRVKGTGLETKKLWFDVYHPDAVDEFDNKISQGKVCMSFEIVPMDLVETLKNAEGRYAPNFYPTLPGPVGRFSFDLFSPLKMLKEIIGPGLYRKICCCIWCTIFMVVFAFVGYFVFTNYIALKLAGI